MIDIAWLAGFFDGEGCVQLRTDGRYTKRNGLKRTYWTPILTITQKDRAILEQIQVEFGGHLYHDGHCSSLRWNGDEAYRMADRLVAFSLCKRPQLEIFVLSQFYPSHSPERRAAAAIIRRMKHDVKVAA